MSKGNITQRHVGSAPTSGRRLPTRHRDADHIPQQRSRHYRPAPGSPPAHPVASAKAAVDTDADTEAGQIWVGELLRRERRVEDPPPHCRSARLCRTVAFAAGIALLCGAVTASATALTGPRTDRAAPTSTAPSPVTGIAALRPDLIGATVELPPTAARPTPVAESRPAPSRSGPSGGGPGPEQDPLLGTVSAFYENAATDPEQAFGLLDPQMRGTEYRDFEQAWQGVERVNIDDIRRNGPDTTLVAVTLERSDDRVIHTLARIRVAPGGHPRIMDATLLSASRS